jgi:hypothetical protein
MCMYIRRRKKLGSVSEQVSVMATCTTLVIKDSYEVLSNRFLTGSRSLTREMFPSRSGGVVGVA